jgi:hypothetical protein
MNRSEYRVRGKGRLAFPYCRDRKHMRAFVTVYRFSQRAFWNWERNDFRAVSTNLRGLQIRAQQYVVAPPNWRPVPTWNENPKLCI